MIPDHGKPLTGKRIGVFGKGGSGKSTAVVFLALGLQKMGYNVCVLDVDTTNLGLPLAFGIPEAPDTLIDYYGGMVFQGGLVTCPVDDPNPLPDNQIYLEEIPTKYARVNCEGITIMVAGKIGDLGPGSGCDGPISKIARDVRIHSHKEEPVTLLDFKAGFEDTARGVITSLDWAIVNVDPTYAAIEMAANFKNTVRQIKQGKMPATRHLEDPEMVKQARKIYTDAKIKGAAALLNKIKDSYAESKIRRRLKKHGIDIIGVIHDSAAVFNAWLEGEKLELDMIDDDIHRIIHCLESLERDITPSLKTV